MQDRILVIDDNQDAAELLRIVLQHLGYDVQVAFNGLDGLALADSFLPDAVISDLGMPIMPGYEVAESIRKHPKLSDSLLLALTGWSDEKTRQKVVAAGFDRHLTKPVDLPLLESTLSQYFSSPHAVCRTNQMVAANR